MKSKCRPIIKVQFAMCLLVYFQLIFAQLKKHVVLWYYRQAKKEDRSITHWHWLFGCYGIRQGRRELIPLNEERLWAGGLVNADPTTDAPSYIAPVKEALFKDSIRQAVHLFRKMQGPNTEKYQPLDDVSIRQSISVRATNSTTTSTLAMPQQH